MSHTAVLPPYHDLLVVVLGRELPGQLGSGWMEPGFDAIWGMHRWTLGRARLRLSTLPAPMRLCVRVGVPARGLLRPLSILVNGRRVWRGMPAVGSTVVRVDLPPTLVAGDSLMVTLLSRRSIPQQWKVSADRRRLGTLVQRVWVEAVADTAHRPVALRARWKDLLAPLWAGHFEHNFTDPDSRLFWLLLGPSILVCLMVGVPLRLARAVGIAPRFAAPEPDAPSARVRDRVPISKADPVQWQRDLTAVEHLFGVVQARAKEGLWNLGSLRDMRMGRLWKRQALQPRHRVLDVGCHVGHTLALLEVHFGVKGIGTDTLLHPLQLAKAALSAGHRFALSTPSALAFRHQRADLVHAGDSVMQRPDWTESLRQARAVKPGGKLVVQALNRDRKLTWHRFERWATGKRIGDAPDTLLRQHPAAVAGVLEKEGLSVDNIDRHHAFFTLLLDEQMPIATHPRVWRMRPKVRRAFFKIMRLIEPVIQCADEPWIWLGQSNAFTVEAHRPNER